MADFETRWFVIKFWAEFLVSRILGKVKVVKAYFKRILNDGRLSWDFR